MVGSHNLSVSSRVMAQAGGEVELSDRLVRPHMCAGDVLLFDCRVLHLGLANTSNKNGLTDGSGKGVRRPMMYVNYHQQWFVDPKNWNNEERLFAHNETQV